MFHLQGPTTWGDFGQILFSGYPVGETEGKTRLMRTGPFMPPITFPSLECVVSDEFRHKLEQSGLTGLSFREVIKHRIVTLHWEKWDRSLDLTPEQLPPSEPEDYLLKRRHSIRSAKALGDLWQLCPPRHQMEWVERRGWKRYPQDESTRYALDWSRSPTIDTDFWSDGGSVCVTEKAKAWLEECVPEWVNCTQIPTVD